mgnify:CR=1 FL=1
MSTAAGLRTYFYRVLLPHGKVKSGFLRLLVERDHSVRLRLEQTTEGAVLNLVRLPAWFTAVNDLRLRLFRRHVRQQDLAGFLRDMGIMLDAGVPMMEALKTLVEDESGDDGVAELAQRVHTDLGSGMRMPQSFARHPDVFPETVRNLAEIGDQSGELPRMLLESASHIERLIDIRRDIRTALIYPVLVFTTILGVGFFWLYYVVPNMAQLGFPLAEVSASGDAVITKVAGSGGCVTVATCTEQLLYEIENPARYLQPDVVADFSQVQLTQLGPDRVQVTGGRGHPRTDTLKVTLGYRDGFIGEGQMSYAGPGAQARGQLALDLVRQRLADAGYGEFEARYDLIGVNAILGPSSPAQSEPAEVRARVALRVPTLQHAQHVAHEVEALYTNGPAGGGGATRAVREVIAAAAVLMPRESVHTSTVLLNAEGH